MSTNASAVDMSVKSTAPRIIPKLKPCVSDAKAKTLKKCFPSLQPSGPLTPQGKALRAAAAQSAARARPALLIEPAGGIKTSDGDNRAEERCLGHLGQQGTQGEH